MDNKFIFFLLGFQFLNKKCILATERSVLFIYRFQYLVRGELFKVLLNKI